MEDSIEKLMDDIYHSSASASDTSNAEGGTASASNSCHNPHTTGGTATAGVNLEDSGHDSTTTETKKKKKKRKKKKKKKKNLGGGAQNEAQDQEVCDSTVDRNNTNGISCEIGREPSREIGRNPTVKKVDFGGVLMEREKSMKLLETKGTITDVKAHEARIIASAKTGDIGTGMVQWRKRFKAAEASGHQFEKLTSDYNLYLSKVGEALIEERTEIERKHSIASAMLKVASRKQGNHAQKKKFERQIDQLHKQTGHMNENVCLYHKDSEELRASPAFAHLQKWAEDKYSFLGSSRMFTARDELEEDERMWSFDRLAEEMKADPQLTGPASPQKPNTS
jgi:hypothetical protein